MSKKKCGKPVAKPNAFMELLAGAMEELAKSVSVLKNEEKTPDVVEEFIKIGFRDYLDRILFVVVRKVLEGLGEDGEMIKIALLDQWKKRQSEIADKIENESHRKIFVETIPKAEKLIVETFQIIAQKGAKDVSSSFNNDITLN